MNKKFWLSLYVIVGGLINPGLAGAHAFSQDYTLPLPLSVFLYGGAGAIAASFFIIGLFLKEKSKTGQKTRDISRLTIVRWVRSDLSRNFLKASGLLILALLVAAGLVGTQFSLSNIAPVFIWVIFTVGFSYLIAIFGNFWPALNPWRTIAGWVGEEKGILDYPKKLGYWPAVVLYFLFIWNEVVAGGESAVPRNLSTIILGYSFINIVGSYLFGIRDWFRYGEFLSVFFNLLGRMSPFEEKSGKIFLRPPFLGVLSKPVESFSQVVFIIFILSSTAYDGFRETTSWLRFDLWAYPFYENFGEGGSRLFETVGLIFSPLLFLGFYLLFVYFSKIVTGSREKFLPLSFQFAPSLLPIALVYHVAHYYTLLVIQGQSIIYLISDPFGLGWDLFGTSGYQVNVGILRADTIWYTQVGLIVLGHIAAVYLSHLIALRVFKSGRLATISQLPMLLLMVLYTLTGLWILAQPLGFAG